jgi:hypothetical protein
MSPDDYEGSLASLDFTAKKAGIVKMSVDSGEPQSDIRGPLKI